MPYTPTTEQPRVTPQEVVSLAEQELFDFQRAGWNTDAVKAHLVRAYRALAAHTEAVEVATINY